MISFLILSIMFGVIFTLFEAGIDLAFTLLPDLIFFYVLFMVIKSFTDKNKKKTRIKANNSNIEEAKIIKNLQNYFKNDARLYFDDMTYIEPSDPENITFDTLNLYMNDEYISSLADYKMSFPNSFNTFIAMVGDYVKRTRFTRKDTGTPIRKNTAPEPQPTSKPATTAIEKDASFYIEKLNDLNNSISEEHITSGLYESVLYLSQIKKIEDTFPKCKTKTTKLYHYYLPMLVDVLENYKRLSINANLHKEFKENEDRLMKTIVLINSALKTLTQSLCDEYYIEMSADMKTLETLLKKDGLISDEMTFDNFKKEEGKVTSDGN